MSSPLPPPEAERLIGGFRLISVDNRWASAPCACANCGDIREVSMIALHELAVSAPGRGPPSRSETRAPTFAGDAAQAESRASRQRHRGKGGPS